MPTHPGDGEAFSSVGHLQSVFTPPTALMCSPVATSENGQMWETPDCPEIFQGSGVKEL